MNSRNALGPTLMEACPEYSRAIERFRVATERGDLFTAEKAWADALKAAHEFRQPKVVA